MKRMISMLMILALLLGSVGTFAETLSDAEMEAAEVSESVESLEEEAQDVFELYGEIVEITDEYVLLSTADMGYVQVNLSDDTVIEGVEALELGQTAVVMYDGMMTRSLPPQISALRVGCYVRTGAVGEITEDGFMLLGSTEEIRVNAEKALLEGLTEGQNVSVYFNGAMTMSLPAQIGAELIK